MIKYKAKPSIDNKALNDLFETSWENFQKRDFSKALDKSLTYICAFYNNELIGFINIAWDGHLHAFLLDTTVHPAFRRKGIGTQLVIRGIQESQKSEAEWIHVDYEPKLDQFYKNCGFTETKAGLINLKNS